MSGARFTPRQLAAFLAVADVRNFARAGERLNLSPSAVSLLIAELESGVGFRLFDRTTRSVALSPAGREFVVHAKSVMRNIELAQAAADDIRNRAAGIVRIAAPLVIATTMMPTAIKRYGQTHPKVVIRIRDAAVDNLVDMVANGDVDLGVGPDQTVGDDVARIELFKSPWVLWCAPDNPLSKRGRITWSDLRKQPVVAAGRDYERNVSLMRAGVADDERIAPMDVVDNISTALGMAAVGLALTLAPAYVGLLARPLGLVMRRIVEPEVMRQVCLYHSASRAVSPAAEGFRQYLVDSLSGMESLGIAGRRVKC
ncbi:MULTISPECIES: LysR family transcriptional regulator [unclassified Burkholderia]|uniref:LysR family transcriptional regulator n=1 Tax=unclassified Burkholderia TaxID=2613784 RepID=UPI000F5684E3|nr:MULTISPECIES: LysR family transcriptional regulator [unclassified Burkholderia]RQR40464.1 LysR family transcriptional regulator [Burkholderia sp. Bp9131]RQR75384.1 LysR family transcriptional regulator [Burkholderia sp. Bp9015]RQZ45388.1 LysR family transcriptional regulator [Burkholderia sp. Bp9099]